MVHQNAAVTANHTSGEIALGWFWMLDMRYLLVAGPALLLAGWAAWKVQSTSRRIGSREGSPDLTGEVVALRILQAHDLHRVRVELNQGALGDHYDPQIHRLRLTPTTYEGRSLSALGAAVHEVGHAIQDERRFFPSIVRNLVVPLAGFGSAMAWVIVAVGFVIGISQLIWLGLFGFLAVVMAQVLNLPIEFDASRRARKTLEELDLLNRSELAAIETAMTAAALDSLAATVAIGTKLIDYASSSIASLGDARPASSPHNFSPLAERDGKPDRMTPGRIEDPTRSIPPTSPRVD